MLAGFAALAVPVILHLIAQQRFPVQPIPNIRLLQSERRTNAYAARPVDLWQLLLRLLVVTLVVLAMTRPALHSTAVGRSARNIIVVLDCSPSMLAAGQGTPSSFQQARAKALELLNAATPRDHVAYIEAGASARIASPLTGDAAAVAAKAALSQISYGGGGGTAHAIARACAMLAARKEALSEVYVLSDMRRNSLDGWDDRDRAALADARRSLGDRLRIHFVSFAPKAVSNVGIVDVKLTPERISTGSGAHLVTTIRNVSDAEQEVALQLATRSSRNVRRTVKVPAGSETIVDLATSLDSTVNTVCKVELSTPDALSVDNACWVPVRLDPRFEVLVIDGSREKPPPPPAWAGPAPAAQPGEGFTGASGARMLEFALNPAQFAASEGRGHSRNSFVKRVTLQAVNTAMMGASQLVVLYNVDRLPQQTMDDLRSFVKSGRSVLIVPGDDINQIDFRSSFVDVPNDTIALCPAAVENAAPVEPGTKVVLGDTIHPVMELFRDPRKGDLGAIQFRRLRKLEPAAGGRVIFSVGQMPAAVEMQAVVPGDKPEQARYRGRICVLGFGLETSWSNISLTRVFVPLVWRLTDHVAGRLGPLPVDIARSGQRAVLDCSDFAPSPEVAVLGPDDAPLRGDDGWPLEVQLSSTDSAVVADLSAIGAYKVSIPPQLPVDVHRADAKVVSGALRAATLKAAIRGGIDSFGFAGGKITREDVAGGNFGRAIVCRNVEVLLANGSSVTGDVPAGKLDEALAGRLDEVTVALASGSRTVGASEVKDGLFRQAIRLGTAGAAGRKARYIGVNLPPGETDTAPATRDAIAASFGEGGWDLVAAAEMKPAGAVAGELWYLVAIGLLLAYAAEGAVGHWLSYRREQGRVK